MRPARDTRILCRHCMRPENQHRGTDSQCPAGDTFPTPSRDIDSRDPKKAARAGAAWDKRIARHWATATTFAPRS